MSSKLIVKMDGQTIDATRLEVQAIDPEGDKVIFNAGNTTEGGVWVRMEVWKGGELHGISEIWESKDLGGEPERQTS